MGHPTKYRIRRFSSKRLGMTAATALTVTLLAAGAALAEDWPTYRHDNRRRGVTPETLPVPLKEAWKRTSDVPPQPAWEGPAKWDAYAAIRPLVSMRDFDPTFFVTVADGRVYLGSSVDDAVHCLRADNGTELWSFVTGGPVRLPPTLAGGRAYFGSDDGRAYCVDAADGKLVWTFRAASDTRKIPCNGRLISLWPVRTGVLVADGKAYFGASLLPWRPSYLCAVDAKTGSAEGAGLYKAELRNKTLQGAMLAGADLLFAMQGRYTPMIFQRADGRELGGMDKRGRVGGVYAVLTDDDKLAYGFGSKKGDLYVHDGRTRAQLLRFGGARRILVTPGMCYLHKAGQLQAANLIQQKAGPAEIRRMHAQYVSAKAVAVGLQRAAAQEKDSAKKAALRKQAAEAEKNLAVAEARLQAAKKAAAGGEGWTIKCPVVHDMILAGDRLVVSGDSRVLVLDRKTGKEAWSAPVSGRGLGLAVADGRLYVSTEDGTIHCFASK